MNATYNKHPARALFRMELLSTHFHGMPLFGYALQICVWVMVALLPTALFLLGSTSPRFAEAAIYWRLISASFLPTMWLAILIWHCPVTLTHRFWELLPASSVPSYNNYEFMVTRAIDRRLHFRMKTAAVALVLLGPLAVALLLSLLHPDCNYYPEVSRVSAEQYAAVFPGSHLAGSGSAVARGEWVIKNGALAFNIWMMALGAFGLIAAHGYYGLMSRIVANQNIWLVFGLLVLVPVSLVLGAAFIISKHFNYGESLVLAFWPHWMLICALILVVGWGILRFCENCFTDLEVL